MSNIYFHPVPYGISHLGDELPTDVADVTNSNNRTRRLVVVGTDEQIALLAQLAYDLGEGLLMDRMRKLVGFPEQQP